MVPITMTIVDPTNSSSRPGILRSTTAFNLLAGTAVADFILPGTAIADFILPGTAVADFSLGVPANQGRFRLRRNPGF